MTTPKPATPPDINSMDALDAALRFMSGQPISGTVDAHVFATQLLSQSSAAESTLPPKIQPPVMVHATDTTIPLSAVKVGDVVWMQVSPSSARYTSCSPVPQHFAGGFQATAANVEFMARQRAAIGRVGKAFGTPYDAAAVAFTVDAIEPSPIAGVGLTARCSPMWETAQIFAV